MDEKTEDGFPLPSLMEHLSKFPLLESIFPMTKIEQAIFIKALDSWRENHEKLFSQVVRQIQDNIDWAKENIPDEKPEDAKWSKGYLKAKEEDMALLVSPDKLLEGEKKGK